MKNWFLGVLMAAVAGAFVPEVAEAKRFGGGMSKGMQRSAPAKPAPQQPPAQQPATPAQSPQTPATPAAATAGATAAAAGTAAKRSWLGPVAGLAAGLGLAALASHLGFGEELASFMLLALLAIAAVVVIRLVMRRMGGAQPAMAGAGADTGTGAAGGMTPLARAPLRPVTPAAAATGSPGQAAPAAFGGLQIGAAVPAGQLPADFDREGFERVAKMIFIRMQAAHDAADLDDLRQFTTPELFADIRLDLQDRGAAADHTDVLAIAAEVQDFAEEDGRQIVSVRYTGQVRESADAAPADVDETWHLVRPADGSRNWAIAGIQQAA
ncbi:Tim44 domain-containing protein [Rubrivivax albus]|uniref:Tim44 domain-containing protein n=1 Tax=Rubrivivax albus TaxID=2499835 RepID=A0A437JY63_9BURK|nr:Tim44-like domain-containing protein [Rubrivivax albus]RVT52606.1 Tim44 domain-containing protein [Rubrivivax albus]